MGEPYEFIAGDTVIEIDNPCIDLSLLPPGIIKGFIATADQDVDHKTRQKLMKENVTAADRESGAVAMICRANNTSCIIIRGITDIPSENPEPDTDAQGSDYLENTPVVMERILKEILFKLIEPNIKLIQKISFYKN